MVSFISSLSIDSSWRTAVDECRLPHPSLRWEELDGISPPDELSLKAQEIANLWENIGTLCFFFVEIMRPSRGWVRIISTYHKGRQLLPYGATCFFSAIGNAD